MAEHLIFHDCPNWTKDAISDYWSRKTRRIERLLSRFPQDQRHLRLTIRRHDDRFEAHAVLALPTGTLVAQADSNQYPAALDVVVDRLTHEIRRHKGHLRSEEGPGARSVQQATGGNGQA